MHGQSLRHVVNKLSLQHSDMDPDYTSSQFSHKYRWNTKHNRMSPRRPCNNASTRKENQQKFIVLPWNTVLTPAQAPTATTIVSLEPAPHHDTFWLLHIHESMQCTAKLPYCAVHALRCCWHMFVYPHKLQSHKITTVLDIQRAFRARQLKVW